MKNVSLLILIIMITIISISCVLIAYSNANDEYQLSKKCAKENSTLISGSSGFYCHKIN